MPDFNFVDVFAGAGGLSCGLEMTGMKCLLGIDHDAKAMKTFAANHHYAATYCGDIKKLTADKLIQLTDNQTIHAVVGGPPCQGFSTVGKGDPFDQRNALFLEFIRMVKILQPIYLVIENVTGLLATKNEHVLRAIFNKFNNLGYHLDVRILSAQQYGVPENRRRTIILGSKINGEIIFPLPHQKTACVADAIDNLSAPDGHIYNHDLQSAAISNPIDRQRLAFIPEGKGIRYPEDEKQYLPKKLRLAVNWEDLPEGRFRQTKYQRLDRKKPSPTIMTSATCYYHPTEDRFLTAREAASIQSFPKDFIFHGPKSSQWRQIGNAVPPLLGKAIGEALWRMYQTTEEFVEQLPIPQKSRQFEKLRKNAFVYPREFEIS